MTLKTYAFTTGWITLPLGSFLEGETGTLKVPVPSYLIRHPKGNVLFDTGMHMAMQVDARARLGRISRFSTIHVLPGEEISAQLARVDLGPEDIDIIINSHLHYDHSGGNAQIPNARLIVQRREWEAAHDADLIARNSYIPDDYDHGHDLVLIDGEHDVFGDGALVCLPTHGHTPGHQSLKIKGRQCDHLLCGDACYLRRSLDEMRPPTITSNREQLLHSLQRIRDLRDCGVNIVYGHDPEFWRDMPQAPQPSLS